MTIVHRNNTDSAKRSYAAVAAVPPIAIPAPVAVQNSFSTLQDNSSESDLDLEQLDWKTVRNSSESEESDTIAYENMVHHPLEYSTDDTTDNSANDSANDSSSDSSQEELIVNQKHYRRVRQPWCKEGVPFFVTSLTGLLVFAYFMQFVFYMCGFLHDDCCSPSARLRCSKGL
jgi:hypothetical protein